jgi:hypothetical protein
VNVHKLLSSKKIYEKSTGGVSIEMAELIPLLQKEGNVNFPNVNLVLSICQITVYLTICT